MAQFPRPDVTERISVPADPFTNGRRRPKHAARAKDVQDHNREQFLKAFAEGLAVLGYERDDGGNGKFLLGRWDEQWSYCDRERCSASPADAGPSTAFGFALLVSG